jgi:recombinase
MEVVRRIFRSVAGGATVYHVRRSLERDGIPAPSGIGRWNHTTIRNIVASELYAPHDYEEVAELVEPGVAMRLDGEAAYGLWAWNTKKPRGARFGTRALAELDETRETAERELEAARARDEALQRLEHDRDALMESYAGMVSETLEDLAPEERHRIYKLLRLGVRFRPDWPLEITGVFAQVREVAEKGSSSCKLTPLSV